MLSPTTTKGLTTNTPLEHPLETEETFTSVPSLYRHLKRNEWGLGVVLERRSDRVTMQFQDGRARAMHLDYWELLEPADRTFDTAHALVTALHAMAPDELRPAWRMTPRPVSLDEQVAYFKELYSEGFQAEEYVAHHRSDGRARLLKKHRDAMLQAAEKRLSREALRAAAETDGAAGVHDALRRVLEVSSIVPAKERTLFAKVDPLHYAPIADAARALIHGKAPIVPRLDAWVRTLEAALGVCPSWELATYFLGACHPDTMPIVRPRVLERQARFMAPGLRVGERPMGILYQRLVAMMNDVRTKLVEHELEARDFLDVFDFVWITLKPAGRERIAQMRAARGIDDASARDEALAAA